MVSPRVGNNDPTTGRVEALATPVPDPASISGDRLVETVQIKNGLGEPILIRVTSDTRKEYVSSHANIWGSYIEGIRSLPHSIDDITRDLGVDLYERMAFDPQNASLVNTIKAATLSQDVDLTPAITDENDPRYELAVEIHDHFERTFQQLDPSLAVVLDNMLDALYVGNKVAEKVYVDGDGLDEGRHLLRKISVKNRMSLFFVVDRFGNVRGFVPALTSSGIGALGVGLYDPSKQEMQPRDKFVILSFRPKDGDPRGTSIFRPAYNAWWLKMQIWPELLKYLSQFGSPSIIGFTDPDSRDLPILDATGAKIGTETPEQIMLAQLEAFRNGAAAAFPPGARTEIMQAKGSGEAFLNSIDLLNRELSKAITGQELATGEGQHQARSASEVHRDILELAIVWIKKVVCEVLVRDVLRPTVLLNWGPVAAAELTPRASLGEVRKQDKAALSSAYIAGGYEIDPSQWIGIDRELNVPPRDPDSIKKIVDHREAMQELARNPPDPVAPPADAGTPPARTGRTRSTTSPRLPKQTPSTPPPPNRNAA